MTLPRSAAEILREHVTLALECTERMYVNVHMPALQSENGMAAFFKLHRGYPVASSALMDPISKAFVAGIPELVAGDWHTLHAIVVRLLSDESFQNVRRWTENFVQSVVHARRQHGIASGRLGRAIGSGKSTARLSV